jgi:crossover junction endodeoxyribonuclease RusA
MNGSYAVRLDFPPSMNTYWRRRGHTTYLSPKGRQYKKAVASRIREEFGEVDLITGRVGIAIELCRGDRRKFDVDNYVKGLCDALNGVIWEDDAQVDVIQVKRGPVSPPGHCDVIVSEL